MKDLKIKISKNLSTHGVLDGSLDKPLVIIVHGLPGNPDEGFYRDAARWFTKNGFSVFRINLYDWRKGSRQLMKSTLKTHAHDLDAVVRYFRRRGVKKIFVAGHSYGAPTILLSKDRDFDAVALWDPSYKISFVKNKYGQPGGKYIKEADGYLMKWGVNIIIGKGMADEADSLDWDSLAKKFHVPVKIISAEKGILVPGARHYFKNANPPKEMTIIKGATHYFNDKPGMQERVFKTSAAWFKKFL